MEFTGISRTFSTENDGQYETIGAFWAEMSAKYGMENLRGLGYNWTQNSIEYVIGLKNGVIDGDLKTVALPDDGWLTYHGETDRLGELYDEIYSHGFLTYEIETFFEDGTCEIFVTRSRLD